MPVVGWVPFSLDISLPFALLKGVRTSLVRALLVSTLAVLILVVGVVSVIVVLVWNWNLPPLVMCVA